MNLLVTSNGYLNFANLFFEYVHKWCVQLRNANRIGTENMQTILLAVHSDPCGKYFDSFSTAAEDKKIYK